jgi:hypothetical protein
MRVWTQSLKYKQKYNFIRSVVRVRNLVSATSGTQTDYNNCREGQFLNILDFVGRQLSFCESFLYSIDSVF